MVYLPEEIIMIINIILYDSNSTIRIAEKAINYLSSHMNFRISGNTIWTNGLYLRFSSNAIIMNAYNSNRYSSKDLYDCLRKILDGEEVFLSNQDDFRQYIDNVNYLTTFDKFFSKEGV